MFNPHQKPAGFKVLQDDIYRERVLRARQQTPEERLADVFELSNAVFIRMHDGAMGQFGLSDPGEGWRHVEERLSRLQKLHDQGRFATERETLGPA